MEHALSTAPLTFPAKLSEEAQLVRQALIERGLETPLLDNGLSRDEKYTIIRRAFGEITETLGLDLREGRSRMTGEGQSIYFHDHDNHLFELHTGTLAERLARYALGSDGQSA